ncbi:phage minor capsid protein [Citricoccus sp.]|uniref:phage minor capsid protein n=1 Tax=Citricoccus sp. TaxID=1978372 RepID=UPI0028BF0311|nr:phage minor capsid protein [Citricoccus sp.]
MAFRPDDPEDLALRLRDMYVAAEGRILQQLARSMARTMDAPDWLTARLAEQRRMIRAVDAILDDLFEDVPGAVERLTALSFNRGAGIASTDAAAAGISMDLVGRARNTATDVVLARAATEPLQRMRLQVRRWTDDVYARTGLLAAQQVASGASTRRDASLRFLQQLGGRGVTGFTDRAGRAWEMGAYAEMVGRTTVAQAQLEGHAERLEDLGVDTVIVSNAPEECNICRPFEGQVLSLRGRTTGRLSDGRTVMTTLGRAKSAGLFHPNCRHSYSIYLPGITKGPARDKADPEGQKLRERQRAYERRIRALKREELIAAAIDPEAGKVAGRKVRAKQAEFKAFRDEHGRKAQTHRTNITAR